MHIGVDATCWQNQRGYGRHARALLSALVRCYPENNYRFFIDSADAIPALPPTGSYRLLRADVPATIAASANGHRSIRDMWRMSRALSTEPVEALLYPTVYTFVPAITRAKKLLIIHDVIAERYPQLTVPRRAARLLWKTKVALGRMQADAIITVSEYSRRGLIEHFGISPEKIFVVGEAGDPVFRAFDDPRPTPRLAALGILGSRPIVTYVGGFSPHKNIEELVAAFSEVTAGYGLSSALLVLVGDYERDTFHNCFRVVQEAVERAGIGDRVVFTGYLPDDDLVVLLNMAKVLVLPSFIEGFGLPAVEAAACGCPVIATRNSPLPELLGDRQLYITPGRNEIAGALGRVLKSDALRKEMGRAGIEAASRLTWDAAARQMMDVIREVVPARMHRSQRAAGF